MKCLPALAIVGLLIASAVLPGQQISPNPNPAVKAAAQADSDRAAAAKQARALLDKDAVVNSIGMKLKLLPAGEFTMGSPNVLFPDEQPPHQVTLSRPFYLGVYEVTQAEYQQVMGKNPSKFKGVTNPVDSVSWDEVVEFCRKLSALPAEKAAGRVYRLPTEAEWEYACRGGETKNWNTAKNFQAFGKQLNDFAWYLSNSDNKTHPVGQKSPNPWGFYDMHGNVWEWCQDWYGNYPRGAVTDPQGVSSGKYRVFRGGCWNFPFGFCRSTYRNGGHPSRNYGINGINGGFRVALGPSGE
ncbi:MAG: formylglycine-generating enzyme family protein [Pirellulaceae bacterium]|nr:formylglycine-generating enzyme family protein [Pirellulaceae bacterium]